MVMEYEIRSVLGFQGEKINEWVSYNVNSPKAIHMSIIESYCADAAYLKKKASLK